MGCRGVTNLVVFADPRQPCRSACCAPTLEQLGFQAESGPWRNHPSPARAEERRRGL